MKYLNKFLFLLKYFLFRWRRRVGLWRWTMLGPSPLILLQRWAHFFHTFAHQKTFTLSPIVLHFHTFAFSLTHSSFVWLSSRGEQTLFHTFDHQKTFALSPKNFCTFTNRGETAFPTFTLLHCYWPNSSDCPADVRLSHFFTFTDLKLSHFHIFTEPTQRQDNQQLDKILVLVRPRER